MLWLVPVDKALPVPYFYCYCRQEAYHLSRHLEEPLVEAFPDQAAEAYWPAAPSPYCIVLHRHPKSLQEEGRSESFPSAAVKIVL